MSLEAMVVALHHSQASGTTKLVLLGIANHEGDGGSWPAVATLARYARCTERSVQRAIGELVQLGEVRVERQGGGPRDMDDRHRPNRYEVLLRCPPGCTGGPRHEMPKSPDSGVTPTSPLAGSGVTPVTPRGDTGGNSGVTPTSPKPSIEPSLEPSITRAAEDPTLALVDGFMDGLPSGMNPDRAGVLVAVRSLPPGWTPDRLKVWASQQNWSGAGAGAAIVKLRRLGPPPKPTPVTRTMCPGHPDQPAGRCAECEAKATPVPAAFRSVRAQRAAFRAEPTPRASQGPDGVPVAAQGRTEASA